MKKNDVTNRNTVAKGTSAFYKGVTKVACEKITVEQEAFALDCMLSDDMCPPMDFGWVESIVKRLLARQGYSYAQYFEWVSMMTLVENEPCKKVFAALTYQPNEVAST